MTKFYSQTIFRKLQQIVFSANCAMMGCRETRKACCLVLGRAGLGPALAWPRVIGERAVNPESQQRPAETQWPLRTLPPTLAGIQATADSHHHSIVREHLCALICAFSADFRSDFCFRGVCDVCDLRVMGSLCS